jgi:hypothetical protein
MTKRERKMVKQRTMFIQNMLLSWTLKNYGQQLKVTSLLLTSLFVIKAAFFGTALDRQVFGFTLVSTFFVFAFVSMEH